MNSFRQKTTDQSYKQSYQLILFLSKMTKISENDEYLFQ